MKEFKHVTIPSAHLKDIPQEVIEYKDLIENYTPEMELIDALDYLKINLASSEILDHLASRSSNEKTDVKSLLKDQIL